MSLAFASLLTRQAARDHGGGAVVEYWHGDARPPRFAARLRRLVDVYGGVLLIPAGADAAAAARAHAAVERGVALGSCTDGATAECVALLGFDAAAEATASAVAAAAGRARRRLVLQHDPRRGLFGGGAAVLTLQRRGLVLGYVPAARAPRVSASALCRDLARNPGALALLRLLTVDAPQRGEGVALRTRVRVAGGYDDGSALYGVAAPLAAEFARSGDCAALRAVRGKPAEAQARRLLSVAPRLRAADWLFVAAATRWEEGELERRLLRDGPDAAQDADEDGFRRAVAWLLDRLPQGGAFEVPLRLGADGCELWGRPDWLHDGHAVEIKTCLHEEEHRLQAAVYACLVACSRRGPGACTLLNVREGTAQRFATEPAPARAFLAGLLALWPHGSDEQSEPSDSADSSSDASMPSGAPSPPSPPTDAGSPDGGVSDGVEVVQSDRTVGAHAPSQKRSTAAGVATRSSDSSRTAPSDQGSRAEKT